MSAPVDVLAVMLDPEATANEMIAAHAAVAELIEAANVAHTLLAWNVLEVGGSRDRLRAALDRVGGAA